MCLEFSEKKVLIFSFDTNHRLDLRQKLYSGHYSVIMAQNRRELKDLATACIPNLIIFDVRNCGSEYPSLWMDLRNDPSTHSIPVIFIMENNDLSLTEAT